MQLNLESLKASTSAFMWSKLRAPFQFGPESSQKILQLLKDLGFTYACCSTYNLISILHKYKKKIYLMLELYLKLDKIFKNYVSPQKQVIYLIHEKEIKLYRYTRSGNHLQLYWELCVLFGQLGIFYRSSGKRQIARIWTFLKFFQEYGNICKIVFLKHLSH